MTWDDTSYPIRISDQGARCGYMLKNATALQKVTPHPFFETFSARIGAVLLHTLPYIFLPKNGVKIV